MSSEAQPTGVVIIHRDRLFRDALASALAQSPGIEVVASAPTPQALGQRLPELGDRIFLVDLAPPGRLGLADVREISQACPDAAIVMLGLPDLVNEVVAACEAGATGYLAEDASLQDVVRYVNAAAAGGTPLSPRMARGLVSRLHERQRELRRLRTTGCPRLTRRELEVIALIDEGLGNREIAGRLALEVQTVKNHVHNVLEKLDLERRSDVVRYVRERGLIPDPAQRGPALWPLPGTDAGS